ncbi:MAG: CPBP family intramembrane metalloprotease [Lachnospiraceae bacterium]|nr:CPBP family intramembrane metalloprotease [Lachnospiraceae bacterium]
MDNNTIENNIVPEVEIAEKKTHPAMLIFGWLLMFLLSYVLLIVGQILGGFVALIPIMRSSDAWITSTMYFQFIGIWVVFIVFMLIYKKDRAIISKLGTKEKGNNFKFFMLGILLGFLMNGVCILVAWLNKDIYMYYDGFDPLMLIIVFIAVFIQSSAEELVCRGFLYQRLIRIYKNPWVAIILNSAFFGCLHLMNPGVTFLSIVNIVVVGIIFSLFVYYYDSIWAAMAMHAAWNYCQNIVFGLPNSGQVVPFSILKLDASTAKDSFAYNVGFGIEGTLFADIVLALGCVVLIILGQRKKKKLENAA